MTRVTSQRIAPRGREVDLDEIVHRPRDILPILIPLKRRMHAELGVKERDGAADGGRGVVAATPR